MAVAVQFRVDVCRPCIKAYRALAMLASLKHFRRQRLGKGDPLTDGQFATGPDECLPCLVISRKWANKKNFNTRGPARPNAKQPGGEDFRVIDDEAVAWTEVFGNIAEVPVGHLLSGPIQDEHP